MVISNPVLHNPTRSTAHAIVMKKPIIIGGKQRGLAPLSRAKGPPPPELSSNAFVVVAALVLVATDALSELDIDVLLVEVSLISLAVDDSVVKEEMVEADDEEEDEEEEEEDEEEELSIAIEEVDFDIDVVSDEDCISVVVVANCDAMVAVVDERPSPPVTPGLELGIVTTSVVEAALVVVFVAEVVVDAND